MVVMAAVVVAVAVGGLTVEVTVAKVWASTPLLLLCLAIGVR